MIVKRSTTPRLHGGNEMPKVAGLLGREFVAAGVIEVQAHGDGWYLISIGRPRGTKRFNLTRGEAAELVRVLMERVITADRPGRAS